MKKAFSISLLLLISFGSKAQDFHLSQFQASPLYLNPAFTGVYTGIHQVHDPDYRIALDARSQWGALGVDPYRTGYLSYDQPLDERFGIGGYLIDNNAGSDAFNMLQGKISGSYRITEKGDPHILSTGIGLGVFHSSIDPRSFTYENQYSSSTGDFDRSISPREGFDRRSLLSFDAELGVFYEYREKGRTMNPYIGVSAFHIPRPKEALLSEGDGRVPIRWVGMLGSGIHVDEDFRVRPGILFMQQASAQELHFRTDLRYRFDEDYSLLFGAAYRLKDAVILDIGIQRERNTLRFSYDINTSYLQRYSGGFGAWEVGLVLRGKKDEPLFHPKFF